LIGQGSEVPDVTITFGPASSSVLARFGEAFGKIPQVLLRDTDSVTDPSPVIRPSSPEIPGFHDRSARLQLFGEIARGGMGAVLKGRDSDLGRDLAVKVLLEAHRDNPDLIRRFVEEAQIAGQLQHPGIVPIYELGAFGDQRPYFAMKLVKGRTLADMLGSRKDPVDDLPRFLGIFEQIAQTVAYAHARGVIHRDLKPSNVMVGSFGEVQVMDWGLAKVLPRGGATDDASAGKVEVHETVIATARSGSDDTDLSRAGSVMGTPSYMAPEQARGEIDQIDERADVFALGSILAEILTGQPAFTGRNSGEIQRKAARGDLAEASTRLESSQADPVLIALTLKCLAAEADDRPRNAGEVAQRVEAYLAGVQERLRSSEIDRARAEAKAAEEHKRVRLVVALAAAIVGLVALGGGGAMWLEQIRIRRISNLQATLARVETLGEQAVSEGADSPRRREALTIADQAIAAIDDLADSEIHRRLKQVRARLSKDEEEAVLDQTFLKELTRKRTTLARKLDGSYDPSKIDENFAQTFQRYHLDIETTPIEQAVNRLKAHPTAFVQSVLSALDHWLIFRSELKSDPEAAGKAIGLRKLIDLANGLDSDPRRNTLRGLLEQGDLPKHRPELVALSEEKTIFEVGPATPLLLARSLVLAGDSPAAITVLKNSVVRFPGDLWTNHQLAELLDKSDPPQWDEAIRYYTAARTLQREAGWGLIPALINRDRSAEAEIILDELSRVEPGNLDILANLATDIVHDRADGGNVIGKRMIAHLRLGLAKNSDDPTIHWKIATIAICFCHSLDLAIAEYREAARLDPTNDICQWYLGCAHRAHRDYERAISAFKEAIRISPDDPSHHLSLANVLSKTGDLAGEIVELREVLRCEKIPIEQSKSSSQKGLDYGFRGSSYIDAYIAGYFSGFDEPLDEEQVGIFTRLAEALARSGDLKAALAVCEEGIRPGQAAPESKSFRLFTLLGNLQNLAGKWTEAIAAYRKAIDLAPDKAEEARYQLGLAQAEASDLPGALKSLQEAIRQDKHARSQPFRLLHAVSLTKEPASAIEVLRRVREQARDKQELGQSIERAIGQFEDFSRLGARLPRILAEAPPLSFSGLCYDRQFFTAAAILSQSVTAPAGDDRYNDACFAALAASGQGHDPLTEELALAKFRAQALELLKAELASRARLLETAKPDDRSLLLKTMQHWKKDTDLAGIRDPEPLAKLSEAERKEWQALWAEVDALIVKAGASKANP
jgi:serine/threonine-protein kinase